VHFRNVHAGKIHLDNNLKILKKVIKNVLERKKERKKERWIYR